jgi:hypothetical protein
VLKRATFSTSPIVLQRGHLRDFPRRYLGRDFATLIFEDHKLLALSGEQEETLVPNLELEKLRCCSLDHYALADAILQLHSFRGPCELTCMVLEK